MINYTTEDKKAGLVMEGPNKRMAMQLRQRFVTSAKEGDDLKPYPLNPNVDLKRNKRAESTDIMLPARSISTFVFSL